MEDIYHVNVTARIELIKAQFIRVNQQLGNLNFQSSVVVLIITITRSNIVSNINTGNSSIALCKKKHRLETFNLYLLKDLVGH